MSAILLSAAAVANAQSPTPLTLKEAETIALQNHPRISAAKFRADAAEEVPTEYRAATLPVVAAFATGGAAPENTRIAAGGLNNPTILSRYSNGVAISQLITDFGRTKDLVRSSQLSAQASETIVNATRADVLLEVNQDYFLVRRAQAVETVAEETVKARQLLLDQVTVLTTNKLKSSLDLTFAKVNLDSAKLMLLTAQNSLKSAQAQLSAALGYEDDHEFTVFDEPLPSAPPPDVADLIKEAIKDRPDLLTLRLKGESAQMFAKAERRLQLPSISLVGAAGYTPLHVSNLKNHYEAAGLSVSFPIFSGHLFAARATEADLKAEAAEKDVADLETRAVRDVRVAWLNANTAYQQIALTEQFVNQATESLDLAKTRYDLGLSSIVELNQAQLNLTEAQIAQAQARYEYQMRHAVLQYSIGSLR
jgi:outer membrane protein